MSVADADATAKAITDAGGTVLVPPMDVMEAGRMAVALDPTGGGVLGLAARRAPSAPAW